jgi:hypothetical protein
MELSCDRLSVTPVVTADGSCRHGKPQAVTGEKKNPHKLPILQVLTGKMIEHIWKTAEEGVGEVPVAKTMLYSTPLRLSM